MKYVDTNKSLGAVDHERGLIWDLAIEPDVSSGGAHPRMRGGLGFGVPLGWAHSSVWLYSSAGAAFGDRTNPLGSYYLGAFGNNYVDDGEVKRYREYESFPGFQIDGIAARRFAKSLAEWNLPPVRFSDVGWPSLYLSHVRTALFAGVLAAQPPSGPEQTLATLGGQADFNFTLALRLPMTFSVGYARGLQLNAAPGFDAGRRPHGEVMASLKIM